MKVSINCFALFICVAAFSACQTGDLLPAGITEKNRWQLVFEDNFDGGHLDTTRWSVGYGWGDRTGWTKEIITARNVEVKNGSLHLSAVPAPDGYYYAGAVNTKNKFYQEHGFFEARFKAAKGQGVLSGWWGKRNNEEWPPEIDIAEIFGAVNPKGDSSIGPWTNSMNIHYKPGESKKKENQSFYTLPGNKLYTDDFHTLAVEWDSNYLSWYIDGRLVKTVDKNEAGFITGPFYWILNLHICSTQLQWPGCPDENNQWPSTMVIDYVRAWKRVR